MSLGEAVIVLLFGAGGAYLIATGFRDVRRGSTKLRRFRAEVQSDPAGFWTVVALEFIVGAFGSAMAVKEAFFGF